MDTTFGCFAVIFFLFEEYFTAFFSLFVDRSPERDPYTFPTSILPSIFSTRFHSVFLEKLGFWGEAISFGHTFFGNLWLGRKH